MAGIKLHFAMMTHGASLRAWGNPKYPLDPGIKLVQKKDGWYLSINVSPDWTKNIDRKLITTALLGKAIIPDQLYTNPDGTALKIDYIILTVNVTLTILSPVLLNLVRAVSRK